MPFIPSYERKARAEGLLKGIDRLLRYKFGLKAESLMLAVQLVQDPQRLEMLLDSISPEQTIEEFRALLPQA